MYGSALSPTKCARSRIWKATASTLERDRGEFIAKVDREGVFGVIGEYFDGERWQHADSCFGFVGDDWKNSGYDTDIMRATLNEAKDARVCRCCGRPLVKKAEVR
jgi:hypothetical protein